MPRYKKKPVVIEAWYYTGPQNPMMFSYGATASQLEEMGVPIEPTEHWGGACGEEGHEQNWDLYVRTLEDGNPESAQVQHIAVVGDWIIKGVQGEFYPCKHEIFTETYEKVEE